MEEAVEAADPEPQEGLEEPVCEEPLVEAEEEFNPLSDITEEQTNIEEPTEDKTEEELALEKQLQEVQRQLLALSTLPSTIQATLDSVTKQLAELLPAFKLQKENAKIASASPKLEVEEVVDDVEESQLEIWKSCQILMLFLVDNIDEESQEPTSAASLRDEIEELKKEIDQINYDFVKDEGYKPQQLEEEDNQLTEEQKNKKKVSKRHDICCFEGDF